MNELKKLLPEVLIPTTSLSLNLWNQIYFLTHWLSLASPGLSVFAKRAPDYQEGALGISEVSESYLPAPAAWGSLSRLPGSWAHCQSSHC